MRERRPSTWAGLALSLMFLLSGTILVSQTPAQAADFFAGKTIRILIGYPPGGGHDIEARVIARSLGKYLPGNPSVIVQNMPGAGGQVQAAYTYNRARPDGLTAALFGNSHLQQALLEEPNNLKYRLEKMPAIWAVSGSIVDIVREFLNAKTAEELLKVDPKKIVVAGRSILGSSCVTGDLALTLLGVKGYKKVCAYRGTSPIRGAFERGEVSFFTASDAHLIGVGAFADMYQKGMAIPVWQGGVLTAQGKIVRSPTNPKGLPTLLEVYEKTHGKAPSGPLWDSWVALGLKLRKITRTIVLPPRTPASRVAVLRQGIKKMATDPKFVATWEKAFGQKLAPVLVSPEEGEALKNEVVQPAPWQEFLRKFVRS